MSITAGSQQNKEERLGNTELAVRIEHVWFSKGRSAELHLVFCANTAPDLFLSLLLLGETVSGQYCAQDVEKP